MKKAIVATVLPIVLFGGAGVAFANQQQNNQTAIDKFKTEVDKVQDIAQNVIPTAIASVVFGAGALLFKRFIYS